MKYIDKDALVAEIEKRIVEYKEMKIDSSYYEGMVASLEFFRDEFIDTLEVKEVDVDKEFERLLDEVEGVPRMWHSNEQVEWAKDIARHFYELGLRTRKEKVK